MSNLFSGISGYDIVWVIVESLIFIKFASKIYNAKKISLPVKITGIIAFILLNEFIYFLTLKYITQFQDISFKYATYFRYVIYLQDIFFVVSCIIYLSIFYISYIVENIASSLIYYLTWNSINLLCNIIEDSLTIKINFIWDLIILTANLVLSYFILTKIITRFLDYKKYTFTNQEFCLLMVFGLTGFASLIFYESSVAFIIAVICNIALIMMSYEIKILRQNEDREKLLIERNIFLENQDKLVREKEEERYKSYQRSIELDSQVRRINHDLMHHFNYLLTCKGLPKEARDYINQLKGTVEESSNYFNTGSAIVDLILEEKCRVAEKLGIKFKVMGDFSDGLSLEPASVSLIFGNLLNNALEGANKVPKDEYRSIDIIFYQEPNKQFYLKLSNSAEIKDLNVSENNIATTKQDKEMHGIGLKSVRSEVEKYNGSMKISFYNDVFIVEINIPILNLS